MNYRTCGLLLALTVSVALRHSYPAENDCVFPGAEWQTRSPGEIGMNAVKLDELAAKLGGNGCIVRHGYLVKTWGKPSEPFAWYSSSKPVMSTLLFFAIEEGKVSSVDEKIAKWNWPLEPKDQSMTFRHLANMVSGYARPEPPGAAFAYNDYGIQLYRLALEKVFQQPLEQALLDRLAPLQFQDKVTMPRFVNASVRDFARVDWLWLNRGRWGEKQLLPAKYFDNYVKPQLAKDLPETDHAVKTNNDYLKIGTYGGGSDHFTRFGPGIYGFNFWYNATGRRHPDAPTWPDAPRDTILTIGFGGNSSVIIPSLDLVLASGGGDWGDLAAGQKENRFNEHLKRIVEAVDVP